MANQPGYRAVPNPPRSELQQFARTFHQDFGLMNKSVHEWAREYIATLAADRTTVLRQELQAFVESHRGDRESVRQAWMKCGAESWPKNVDLRETLRRLSEGKLDADD